MRHVARILAASLAASVLSISAPAAQAAPATVTSGISAPSSVAQSTSTLTAAEKRKQRIAKKKRLQKIRAHRAKKRSIVRGKKIVRTASKYQGSPYRWGGTSPSGFDCSGYVKYVVKKSVKKNLPRLAGDQLKKGKKVSKSKKRKGDLIGFYDGSYAYHIAIYAGHGKIWHAPRPGKSVEKVKIWTSSYKVRRLRL